MTTYFLVEYDNEASGPFTAEGANLTYTGGVAFVVSVIDRGTTGKLYCALVSGPLPSDNDVLTQSTTTADAAGDGIEIAYPAYFREDVQVASTGNVTWTGPALGATHSFNFDGQTGNVTAGDILTWSGGQECEVITVESDAGATGELSVRWISDIDLGLPADNDTFSNGASGDGALNGVIHDRAYSPLHLHRLFQDLNDDDDIAGNDDWSRVDYTPSGKDTTEIINLLGDVNITDEVAQHMYGGSISQVSGGTLYSGANIQVTSPNEDTQPILIQNDGIITDYWKNAYMPDSIAGNVRILVKTRQDGVDIDGKRLKGKLNEFGDSYFTGGTTLGTGVTALALFSSTDGNNGTAAGTVAGAPYNSIVLTEGYQQIDFNNGNGATPFGLSIDFGSASSLQTYERTKWIQRRGTAETLFGRNAALFDGINLNFAYDAESANLTEDEIVAWGCHITFTGQTTNFTDGEVVTFSGGSRGRLIAQDDNGTTGFIVVDLGGAAAPAAAETITGLDSGGDGTIGVVTNGTTAGQGLLVALDDDGTTGNLYLQLLTGLAPVDNQLVYGTTSGSNAAVDVTIETRTVNNQFVGVYTGSNFQTNFGVAIDSSDAIVGDLLRNLLDTQQEPPNNQQGRVTGLKLGDTVTVYPWDGVTTDVNGDSEPDYNEATIATSAITAGSTSIEVTSIPDNTPAAGLLRVERDSDGNMELIEYASWTGNTYTLVGTAGIAAAIGNNVMRAFLDEEMIADGTATYTSVYGPGDTQTVVTVLNGYTAVKNGPIKVFKASPTFGSTGFTQGAVRTSDA